MILTFQGHVTSLVTLSFDLPYAVSYPWSLVTECLFPTVFEILNPKRYTIGSRVWPFGPRDVIGHVTIRFHFLLVVLYDQASIS